MDAATPVSIRLRRSTPTHDAYTVRLANHRFAALATARPADARRWVTTTRWLHAGLLRRGRLVVGLGVQWTPTRRPLHGAPPPPATLQLCVGHRCLVFHIAQADAIPETLRRFLADPRVAFVGSGSANDRRMLWVHYGIHVASGRELRAMAGIGNASMEEMADRFLGYPGIEKPWDVAMSAWHVPRLSMEQVEYACVDAYLAFRLGVHLCPAGAAGRQPQLVREAPPAQRAPVLVRQRPAPPAARAPAVNYAVPSPQAFCTVPRVECSPRAFCGVAAVGVNAANSSSKVVDTRASITRSDTDAETDYDGDVGDTATHGLPIRAYASDSDDDDFSSDGFEHVRFGVFTDEEEDEDDGVNYYVGAGPLGVDDVNGNGDDQEDEDDYTGYTGIGMLSVDVHDEEGNKEYTEIGILTADNNRDGSEEFVVDGVATANVEEEVDGDYQAFQYLGHSDAVFDHGEDDVHGQDDWYDQEDYGIDQDDDDGLEEFYLL
ncbi:uncharacterized protein LOC133892302 [Phragmites australis]|uniref:uncharacterized protein LOC133892302 n=1 Tax=Phragmites australis TaxID=29695 RepID=UPI002D79A61C|nr:uncharacterized protein LOC133892302 [Phragmites australis]